MRISKSRIGAAMCAVAMLGLGITGCGSSDNSAAPKGPDSQTVRIGYLPGTVSSWLPYLAQQLGFFSKHGVKADFVTVPNGVAGVAAEKGGSVDITPAGASLLAAHLASGEQFQAVSGVSKMYWTILGKKGEAAANWPNSLTGLKGKKVGLLALSGDGYYLTAALLSAAGLNLGGVSPVAAGNAPTLSQLLAKDQVSAAVVDTYGVCQASADEPRLFSPQVDPATVPSRVGGLLKSTELIEISTSSWVRENPRLLSEFQAAYRDTVKYAQDPANLAKIAETVRKSDLNLPKLDDQSWRSCAQSVVQGMRTPFSTQDAQVWKETVKTMTGAGSIDATKLPPVADWIAPGASGG